MNVRVKSKISCLLWCVKNGIIKPSKYYFSRIGKHKEGVHNYFSYDKFKRCGKKYSVGQCVFNEDYYECMGYEFHKDCLEML